MEIYLSPKQREEFTVSELARFIFRKVKEAEKIKDYTSRKPFQWFKKDDFHFPAELHSQELLL